MSQACSAVEADAVKSTSIVVLGYSCNHATATPSLPLQHRLTYAASVASGVGAEVLVCSGGIDAEHDQTLPSEAEIMAGWLLDHIQSTGQTRPELAQSTASYESAQPSTVVIEVSATDTNISGKTLDRDADSAPLKILTERRSTSTRENALYSMTVLAEHVCYHCARHTCLSFICDRHFPMPFFCSAYYCDCLRVIQPGPHSTDPVPVPAITGA